MAKYERDAMIVMRVVMVWNRRRETGTFQDKPAKVAELITMTTKTTHSIRVPDSWIFSTTGRSGTTVGSGVTLAPLVDVGRSGNVVASVLLTSAWTGSTIMMARLLQLSEYCRMSKDSLSRQE